MAVNKVVYGTTVLVDLTEDTVTPSALAEGYTAHDKSGAAIVGTATGGSMVIRDSEDSHGGTIRNITAGSVVQGTKTITENGTYDVAEFADASVNVPAPEPELQAKTATPSTSQQTITADSGYDGLSQVTVSAMPSGSATTPTTSITANPSISVNSSTGLITASVSGSKSVTPSVSAGYVSSGTAGTVSVSGSNTSQLTTQAAKTVTPSTSSQTAVAAGRYTTGAVTVAAMPSGTAGTPSATKGTVSNHSVSVTPSVTNTTGYITGGTKTGIAVTVSASELVSGTLSVTENGTVDVTNYASASVNVPTSNDFVITLTYNDQTEMWEPDCTFAEALSAHQAGKTMVASAGDYNGAYITYANEDDNDLFYYVVYAYFDEPNGTAYYNWGTDYQAYVWTSDGIDVDDEAKHYDTSPADAVPSDVANGKRFYNASGIQTGTASGGGGSSYTLIYSTTMSVSTSSTSAVTLNSVETGDTSIWTSSQMVYVKVRDTAGPRNGYFYGTDCMFTINAPAMGLSATMSYLMFGQIYMANAKGVYSPISIDRAISGSSASGYGVYPTIVNSNGSIEMKARYNRSNTGTIDGTFSVEVYLLGWPNDESPLYGN